MCIQRKQQPKASSSMQQQVPLMASCHIEGVNGAPALLAEQQKKVEVLCAEISMSMNQDG